jgi:uncharacterized protein with PIN domain
MPEPPRFMPRAPLRQTAWCVRCPGCETDIEIDEPEILEDQTGKYVAMDAAAFPICDDCGLPFEAAPVQIVDVADA